MDLIQLSKKAVRQPLNHKNFYILFVTAFFFLIIGLSLLAFFGAMSDPEAEINTCNSKQSQSLSGRITPEKDVVYQMDYQGNDLCILSAVFTWKNPDSVKAIWVYNPQGEIEVIEPHDENSASFTQVSPLESGKWRFVMKANGSNASFSGNLSLK